jgi:mono/diheme cytochrome c family protein
MSAPSPNPMPDNIDYAHTSNVARLHAAAARERSEPVAKPTPISLSIIAGIIALALIAGSYLGANKGSDFSAANIKGYFYPLTFSGVETSGTIELSEPEQRLPENWLAAGKTVYGNNCVTCHTATGEGQAGLYPPLKASEFVIKGEKLLVAIL